LQTSVLETIRACQQNDIRAQERLYRLCYPDMIRICQRYAFGDNQNAGAMYNEAMLKVFRKVMQFREDGEVMGWIRKLVVSSCIDYCRRSTGFQAQSMPENEENDSPVIPEVYHKLSGNDLQKMIHQLPKNTGLVFNLFVIEGYKHQEIAMMIGISAGTSKWHLNEARRLLKQKIELTLTQEKIANAI
jgi:RNA polymerase sigma-70 factor (ECF subfamily)